MSNFISPALKADQIAWSENHRRLPSERMVLANKYFQSDHRDFSGDHVGELRRIGTLFNHGKPRKAELERPIKAARAE
jgi:hypothetical protein